MEYPIESGQLMLVRPNRFDKYTDYVHTVVCFGQVVSSKEGILVKNCSYVDDEHITQYIDIPLFLLWRIADDEDLLEMHEIYVHSTNIKKR